MDFTSYVGDNNFPYIYPCDNKNEEGESKRVGLSVYLIVTR